MASTNVLFCVMAVSTVLVNSQESPLITRSNGIFSSKFYNAVSSGTGSVLISPLSLNYALTLTSLGTGGNTLIELRKTLNQPDDQNQIISDYGNFSNLVKNDKNLVIANRMYIDNQFAVKEEFKNNLRNFDSEIGNTDFVNQPEESRKAINQFVDSKTNHLIPELFGQGSISKDTVSIIVNAVYFKSKWLRPFRKSATEKKTFYSLNGNEEVDMMYRSATSFDYVEDTVLNAQIIELPYEGGYSFIVILPKEKDGITKLEKKLKSRADNTNSSPFTDLLKDAGQEKVIVHLPKFKFEQTHNLRHTLEEMGIKDLFSSKANFTKLSDNPVVVSAVIQKTYITVSEEYTEAAAATGINIQPLSANFPISKPVEFNADHPFIYIIKHTGLKTPLFVGRFMSPKS